MTRLLSALRAAFGSHEGAVEEQPPAATPRATRARHRAEPSEDARRADDHVSAGRHRASAPA